jgi:hypothetical protein
VTECWEASDGENHQKSERENGNERETESACVCSVELLL